MLPQPKSMTEAQPSNAGAHCPEKLSMLAPFELAVADVQPIHKR
jgi:hypothetical protein